jgi:glycosyltransferase involved in cell wall biosynthesis
MRRIAYCSPINPVHSGISDYSEELLPYLGQYADITVYIDHGMTPTNLDLSTHVRVRSLTHLIADHAQHPYDAILYHMGNSPAHFQIWDVAQQLPGVVVLHDLVLHHFMLQYHAVHRRNIAAYTQLATHYYADAGSTIAERMLQGVFDDSVFQMPLCQPVLNTAQLVISHSHYVADAIATLRPDCKRAVVPMGVPVLPVIDPAPLRDQLHLGDDAFIIASFGHVNPYKRVDQVLRTIRTLRRAGINAHYIIVGSVSPNFALDALVRRTGTQGAVHVTGYASATDFALYVAVADVCINLRHPTAGETSASLLRLLAAAKPTVITASGSFLEIPRHAAIHIPLDQSEGAMLTASTFLLHQHPQVRHTLGHNARTFVQQGHTLADSANAYMHTLADHFGWETPVITRAPLWNVEPVLPNQFSALPRPLTHHSATIRTAPSTVTNHDTILPYASQRIAQLIKGLWKH